MSEYRVGMVGYRFMGKAHSHAYRNVAMFFPGVPAPLMQTIAGQNAEAVRAAAAQFGWAKSSTDWRAMVESDDIDIVDICAPGDVHPEIAIAAAEAGKHVFCEKPLANSLTEARAMADAARKAGVTNMVCFNYRFLPAVALAKRIITDGRLGTIYHIRSQFLQDWILDPEFPLVWRLRKEVAGSGSLGDLGAHLIDLARYLVGEFTEVTGMSEIFIKQRPLPAESGGLLTTGASEGFGEVTVDDATLFLARFANGALGTFEATRFAPGHRCTNSFEINGSKGSVRFDFERMNELAVYFTDDDADVQGFRTINCNDDAHPYGGTWWPSGHGVGYENTFTAAVAELLGSIGEGRPAVPSFDDGVACQQVLDAVEASASSRSWVTVADL